MATANQSMVQLNVRMPRELKEQGDATLALVGSSPAKIIRQLWERLAQGGEAYERVAQSLADDAMEPLDGEGTLSRIRTSTSLFVDMGRSLGLDTSSFTADLRPEKELLEEIEWELLTEKGLA